MAQTPVTGNLVNNGEPRDETDFYLNVWFYDPHTRFLHLGFQGYVGAECWLPVLRGCYDIKHTPENLVLEAHYKVAMALSYQLPIAEPIRHHCGESAVLAWNHSRATSQQTNWQDGKLEPSVPNAMPSWENPIEGQAEAMTLLMRLPDNCCYGPQ